MVKQFLKQMEERTGWSFTVLTGGPDPCQGGEITTKAIHSTENLYSQSFGKAHPSFTKDYLQPFSDFLHQVYRKFYKIINWYRSLTVLK